MGLFASLSLPTSFSISLPSLHVLRLICTLVLHNSALLSPFMSLSSVCLCLEDQTGASCFTSPAASSQSQIGTNCSNNNTRGGLGQPLRQPRDQEQQTSQSQHNSVGTVCREMGRKVPTAVQQKRTSEQESPQEKTGIAYKRKKAPIIHGIATGSNTNNNAAVL